MKKIFLIFMLFASLNVFGEELSNSIYFPKAETKISNALSNIDIKNNEFARFFADLDDNKKLTNIKVAYYTIDESEINKIISKLSKINFPSEFDNIKLKDNDKLVITLFAKPNYETNRTPTIHITTLFAVNQNKENINNASQNVNAFQQVAYEYRTNHNLKSNILYLIRTNKNGNIASIDTIQSSQNKAFDEELKNKILDVNIKKTEQEITHIIFASEKSNTPSEMIFNHLAQYHPGILPIQEDLSFKIELDKNGIIKKCENVNSNLPNEQLYAIRDSILKIGYFPLELMRFVGDEEKFDGVLHYSKDAKAFYITIGEYSIINWAPIMASLEKEIKRNWKPNIILTLPCHKKIVIMLDFCEDNTIQNIKITKSSGNKELDDYTIQVIKNAKIKTKFPQDFPKDRIPIEFTFEYKNTTKDYSLF